MPRLPGHIQLLLNHTQEGALLSWVLQGLGFLLPLLELDQDGLIKSTYEETGVTERFRNLLTVIHFTSRRAHFQNKVQLTL